MIVRALSACIFLALPAPAFSAAYNSSAPVSEVGSVRHHHAEMGRIGLSKELKVLWRHEEKSRLKALPKDQRHGWLRTQWSSMNEGQRAAKVAELEARWKALPSAVREAMLEKIRERREARRMRHQEPRNGENVRHRSRQG